jgi:predicted branched-subunit amino acid permease
LSPARTEFQAGLRAGLQLLIAIAPFGLVTGVAMAAGGVPPVIAMAMSVLVYAGASMIAASQLIFDGAPALVVVLAAAVVNLRLLMYSASIRPYFGRESLSRRLAVSYLLVDNAFAHVVGRFSSRIDAPCKFEYLLGLSLPVWLCWQLSVGAGILVGAELPSSWKLDFAAPLAFIALTVPLLRDRASVAAAASAGVAAVLLHGLPLRTGLAVAAAVGIAAGLAAEKWLRVEAP